jgi:hypothetical protein
VFAFRLDQKVANAIQIAMTPEWRQAISWILAGLFGLICLTGWEIWSSRTFRFGRANSINWDISINDALDYIVNDSTETFPLPPTMEIRGMSIPATGTQHQAALSRLNQKLTFGDLDISGHKEIIPQPAPRLYEEVRRKIDQQYWEVAQLHPLNCFHYTTKLPQTYIMSGDSYPKYYNLRMNRDQLRHAWPQKGLLRRLWERWALRKQRLHYYHGFG